MSSPRRPFAALSDWRSCISGCSWAGLRCRLTRERNGFRSGFGTLFAGNVFLLFKAIETIEVPIAILTYFVYPVLTGLAAAASGLERMTWKGAAAAIAAFLGLALMIGVHPTGLAVVGIVAALAAALCRVAMLLVTRAMLQGADPLLMTWYSLVSSTVLFALVSLATLNWQPPMSAYGWAMLLVLGIAITTGIGMFASTIPHRTIPHGAVHGFRAAARHRRERTVAGGSDHAAAGARRHGQLTALVAFQVRR